MTPDPTMMPAPMIMKAAGTIQRPNRRTTSTTRSCEPSQDPAAHHTATSSANTPTVTRLSAMTLRNRGEPAGFARIGAPAMAAAMRRANRKDLAQLKSLLEQPAT